MRTSTPRTLLAGGTLALLATLTACSGGGSGDSTGDSAGSTGMAAVAPSPAGEVGSAVAGAGSAGGRTADTARTLVQTRSVIRTGEISLTSKHLDRVRAEVERLVKAVGGSVEDDRTSADRAGRTDRATMTLRVPVASFDATRTSLERLGRLRSSDQQGRDVTTEVIDVDERVQTLQNSLDRLQRFQSRARDVGDLLRYEDQITSRQAELQSLTAQQTYLHDQTAMSTITLRLSTPARYVAPPDPLRHAGFGSGLRSGWNALLDVLVVAVTVLGAVVPFAVAGALVGVPTWVGLRRWLRRRRSVAAG